MPIRRSSTEWDATQWYNLNTIEHYCFCFSLLFPWLIWIRLECREYEKAKVEKKWVQVGFDEAPQLIEQIHCATTSVPLIVGGEEAVPGEFPHMVSSFADLIIICLYTKYIFVYVYIYKTRIWMRACSWSAFLFHLLLLLCSSNPHGMPFILAYPTNRLWSDMI